MLHCELGEKGLKLPWQHSHEHCPSVPLPSFLRAGGTGEQAYRNDPAYPAL